jgi:hypothetical protein
MAYFTNSISSYIFTSSDELFLFDVLKDLMHGGSINNWYLSGAFQFFPAIPILSIIYLFTIKIYYIAYFYAIIQILLFYFIVAYFLKVFLSSKKSYYITSIFIWICVYLGINFNDYNLLFIHSFHFETFMLSVLSYGLILNCYKKNNADIVRLLYLSVIQILGIMSDRFFVVWLVAPLLIVLSILYFTDKYFKKFLTIKICLLLFFNTIVAIILYKLIFIHSFEPDNYFIFQSRYAFQNKIMSMLLSESFITIIILIFIGYIIFLLKNNNKIAIYCQINDLFKLSILLLKVLFILLVTILSVGQYFIFTMRYCIPLLYINTFILMFLCYQILGNKLNLTIIIILSGLFTLKYFDHMKFNDNYYHDDIKCVENILNKYHVKYGLSDYWVARRFNYINQSNIDIVPIDRYTYKHMLWMDNEKHKYKSYDFILISSESPLSLVDSIIKLNGKPEFIGRCNQYEIVIYKNFMLKKY